MYSNVRAASAIEAWREYLGAEIDRRTATGGKDVPLLQRYRSELDTAPPFNALNAEEIPR